MKKIILFLFALFAGAGAVKAQPTDMSGLKIYINPGHGGRMVCDDRNVASIPFPTTGNGAEGYWESESNLTKGLYLRDILQAAGANVMMSRVQNRTPHCITCGNCPSDPSCQSSCNAASRLDDRNLSEIVAEANAYQPDGFVSIHSNAQNSMTNYLLLLYSGTDAASFYAPTRDYAYHFWPYLHDNPLTVWNGYTSTTNVRGDVNFYGTNGGPYLGVLNGLVYRAFLSEGSFHDYRPETHRLLNADYCHLEAIRFYNGFHSFFGRTLPNKGTVGGWVKSANVKIINSLFRFIAGSTDQWHPLNGATVELLNAAGTAVLDTYTTDDWYNGVFAFYDVDPGNYKLAFACPDHLSDTADIVVTGGQIAYSKMQLFNLNVPVDNSGTEDYPNLGNNASVAMDNYTFYEINQAQPSWLTDATTIKRAIHRNDKIYVLTTEPKVYVIDASTYALIVELNMTGISGGTSILSDIAFTADNYLVGCNKENIAITPTTYFKVYTWDSDVAAPTLLLQSQKQGNWNEGAVGETFAVSGIRTKLKIYTTAKSTGSATTRIVGIEYEDNNGTVLQAEQYKGNAEYSTNVWGENHIFTISPSGDGDHFYVDSDIMLPTEYQFDWSLPEREPLTLKATFAEKSGYQLGNKPSGFSIFRLVDHFFMVSPVCEANGANVGVVMFDITDGIDNAVKVSEQYPQTGLGATPTNYMGSGYKVEGYDIDLLIWAKNQGIGRYRTSPATGANIYASELSITASNEFKFTLNADATSVIIELYDAGFLLAATFNLGALPKGTHVIAEDFSALPSGTYTWSVTAKAAGVDRPGLFSDDSQPVLFYAPRGVAVDNNMQSHFFGRVYVGDSGAGTIAAGSPSPTRTTQRGIYILDAALSDITNQGATSYAGGVAWQTLAEGTYQHGPLRIRVAEDGKVYIPSSHYKIPGLWIMDSENPSTNFIPVFGGTCDTLTGAVTNGGTNIHNPIVNCYVAGMGTGTQLFTMDRPSGTPANTAIRRYDIGDLSGLPWTGAPTQSTGTGGFFANGYGSMAPDGNDGWWVAQYRAGSATVSVPCFVHIAANGTVDFNSSSDMETAPLSTYHGAMTLNHDGTLLAVCSEYGTVNVYDIEYSSPIELTLKYTVNTGGSHSIADLAFDVAGNLYIVSPTNERLKVFGLPKGDNQFTSYAPNSAVLTVSNTPIDEPNIYASELAVSTIDSIAYTFSYTLNARASSLVLELLDNSDQVVSNIPITASANRSKGVHKFTTNVTGLAAGVYKWRLTATGALRSNSATELTLVSNNDPQFLFYSPRGVAVDNTFDSEYFGRIYAVEVTGGNVVVSGTTVRTTQKGVYILNSALNDTTSQGVNAYNGGVAWAATNSPFRASVAPDGRVFLSDWSDAHAGVWIMDAANPAATFNPVFGGTRDNNGLASSGGVNIHGSIPHCWVTGTSTDTKLYTIDEDYTDAVATMAIGNVLQYNIGDMDFSVNKWETAPSAIVFNKNTNTRIVSATNMIAPDDYGWWITQACADNGSASRPAVIHVNSSGVTDYSSDALITTAYGAMAISPDGTLMAIPAYTSNGNVRVYDITYTGDIPSLVLKYTVNVGGTVPCVAFDNANNLYIISNGVERLLVYALPVTDNNFTTPAPSTSVIVVSSTVKPVVVSTIPVNGATNVPVNIGTVSATFNKEMNTASAGTMAITAGGAAVGTLSSPVWTSDSKTVSYTFTGTLNYSTTYSLEIKGFDDTGGNVIDDTESTFATEPKPVQKVTLFVNKDYAAWEDHGKIFNLRQKGEVKYIGEDNLDGTVTFQDVEDGLYRLYDGLYDGAIDIRDQVVYGTTGFGLSYFTVRFGLQNEGRASGSVIDAVYNGRTILSGDVIVEGKRLNLTAKGNGAATYTYLWRGSFNGNNNIVVPGETLSADVLNNIVDVHCTITGTSDEITVYNVITPNGDGKNDFLVIEGLEAYQSNELIIFNRSSTEVFKTKNYINSTWDGGNLVSDVYFYKLTLVDANGKVITKTGYLHLKK